MNYKVDKIDNQIKNIEDKYDYLEEVVETCLSQKKTQENQASHSYQDTNDKRNKSGIYLRDDHCDWGSSGMNEFTNEYNSN